MVRKGLTLMELLIVTAIIVVLAGFVFVIVNEVRWRVSVVQCSSNLRQIGLALRIYAQDWHGFAPPYSNFYAWTPNAFYKNQATLLEAAFEPYVKDKNVWLCPQDPNPSGKYGFTSYRIRLRYGYTAIAIDSPPIMVPADFGDPRYWACEGEPPSWEDWQEMYERCRRCVICVKASKDFGRWIYATCDLHKTKPGDTFAIHLFLSGNVIARRWPMGILHGCPAERLPEDWPYDNLPH